ncbi:MAG TPA: hypothetical protein VM468_10620 [Mycoplana sp.]|jgi:hypothetical protein|nr:hypothetical protein [Mycoplana sp.]
MSSNIQYVNFRSHETRMLRDMLKNAGYKTSNLKPLLGPQWDRSQTLLQRFMSGVLHQASQQ